MLTGQIRFTRLYVQLWTDGIEHSVERVRVCNKTALVTSSVSGAGVNPPPRKMNTFFHRSLALSVPIYGNFQSNGVNWRSIKR